MARILVFWISLSCIALAQTGQSPIVGDPPKDVSISNIIHSFAAKEKDLRRALEQYSYTREVILKANCQGSQFYDLSVDVGFDRRGNRLEKVKSAQSTLQCIAVSKEDLDSFRNQTLPMLTTDEIQNYQFNFIGEQHQDSMHFYVFDGCARRYNSGQAVF